MSEQTANLCTTDACESLRARLAKYEDAEGNPISTISEQVREIERLSDELENTLVSWGQVRLELAALKAQPGGVVLPERKTKADYGVYIDEFANEAAAIHNATLDEVARLNHQPASGGVIVPEEFICDSKPLQDLLNATALLLETPCQDSATYWAAMLANVEALLKPISAGVVDERAAFEVEIPSIAATFDGLYLTPVMPLKAGDHLMTIAQHLLIEKQFRAALTASAPMPDPARQYIEAEKLCEGCGDSEVCCRPLLRDAKQSLSTAPSSGEKARAVLEKLFDAVEWATNDMGNLLLDRELTDEVRALLAAAPSAGSHGGDV